MIVLDTHAWVWWISSPDLLTEKQRLAIVANEASGLMVSAISCWEIAKKVALGKIKLDRSIDDWMNIALNCPGIRWTGLSPQIVIDSTRLPGEFHKDPADQLIVATARMLDCPLLTSDQLLLKYPNVKLVPL